MDLTTATRPRGALGSKYMIIFSHPTKDDLQVGAFGRSSGNALEVLDALKFAGISEDDCYFTGMVRNGIGTKPKPSSQLINDWAPHLDAEIEAVKPQIIISLGAEVFKRLMKTNMKVGDYLGEIIDSPYGKLLANYSPGMVVVQDPTKRPEFQETFDLARRFIDNKLWYQPFTYQVVNTPEENTAILQKYIAEGKFSVGYDAEWCGQKMTDDEVMYDFQYSCEPHHAVILNISKDGVTENRELLDTMKLLLEDPRCDRLGWNIRADDLRLTLRGFTLADETLGFDGMKAVAFFDSRMSKALDTGIKKFTYYDPYYVPFYRKMKDHKLPKPELAKMKFYEPDLYYRYCGGDAVSHRTACLKMRETFPEATKDYYFNVYLPLTNYFLDMEITGIPVDMNVLRDITDKYVNKYEELRKDLELFMVQHFGIADFNPNSAPQKKEFLFTTLELPPAFYTKSGKSPKPRSWYVRQSDQMKRLFQPSTNSKSLSTIKFELDEKLAVEEDPELRIKYRAVELLLNISRVGVFATKFLSKKGVLDPEDEAEFDDEEDSLKQSYWAAICNDGKIHASFYELLKNFRSSSSPNVQNPASKVLTHIPNIFVPGYNLMLKDEQKKYEDQLPENIRRIFHAGNPDYNWVELDIAGADLAIMAFLSQDPAFIADMRAGNFHQTKMREYFQDPALTKKDVSKYVISKSITFRVSYTAGLTYAAVPIQAEIYAENGLAVGLELITSALNTWNRYERYMQYRDECTQEVVDYQQITNARGMVLKYEQSDNFGVKAGWANESLAFPIASELALFMWEASINCRKILKKEGLWMKYIRPVLTVHDANYWIAHKDLLKDNYLPELLKYVFCKQTKLATGDNVGCELTISDRWKGSVKHFDNETVWNNQTQSWGWK